MLDFIMENAGFVVIVAFVLYALAIYKSVDVIKRVTADIEALQRWRVAMAVVIGGVTGPFAYPFLFTLLGETVPLPIPFSIIMGVGTGGVAVNIYNFVEEKLSSKRE